MSKTLNLTRIIRLFRRRNAWLALCAAAACLLGSGAALGPFVQAQTNPIVLENSLPGSPASEWDVSAAGDPSIQGFATDISVTKGDTVSFKVNTDSNNYTIDIYRLGYYNGFGARKLATLVPSAPLPQIQPACLVDGTTGLADCGNWAVSASWSTAAAVSGIYVAKLKRTDTGGSSHMIFIVRDDARQADVVVQTSDTTWQAYNRYGGGSLYCNGPVSNLGTVYSCAGRATKVSYNRPFDTREHEARSFLFSAEYPMVRWLEANGYDVKYISGVDTERRAADLVGAQKPKAFLSVGHDEYWSAGQRAGVEAARNAGVNLAFFSGNEIYWKTRWEASVDGTNTPYRTLVSYKDTLRGLKLDPLPGVSTGTWRDTRFGPPVADGGRPENSLAGQIWTVNQGTTAISVPASMAGLRFWRNTRVAALTSGTTTLGTNTLGYEWDEDLDNGARPNGLIHLSSTTVNGVEKILDFGQTVGIGTATHTLTLYRHASGALVFGAGTVQWAWGLDGNHDLGSDAPDVAMQQATMNLLADMRAQPATVQTGLIASSASADVANPTSVVTSPASGATVGSGDSVLITGTASDSGGVVAAVDVSVDGGATWHAAQGTAVWSYAWSPGALGPVTILSRAVDDSGNRQTPGAGTTVSVVASLCPCPNLWSPSTVPSVVDANDVNAVELGLKFQSDVAGTVNGVRFYKSADNLGTHIGNLWTSGGTLLARATFATETGSGWQEVLFDVPVSIAANTTYVVSYHTNVGHYSASGAYFSTAATDRPPLHAPASSTVGGNGVFVYGPTAFPTGTFNATNYWVDVVFSSVPDTAPPMIGDVSATPIDSSTAVVTWTTDEPSTSSVDYSTDSMLPVAQTVTVSDASYVTAHSIRLTGLAPSTAYFFRVRSVDRAGNQAAQPPLGPAPPPVPGGPPTTPQGFTTPSVTLHDTTTGDFSAGTSTGTYVSETGDGEVILAPAGATEFSGSVMPANWSTNIWSPGGSAVIGGGRLTVDGARVAQEQADVSAGHSLEFVATFTGDPFQHSGYGQNLATNAEPSALFSTSWVATDGTPMFGGSLAVRTFDGTVGSSEISTNLGIGYFNAPHRFRIDWQPASVTYSIDGVAVATHAVAITRQMRPVAASDFSAFSGTIVVDWVRTTPYASAGSFVSRVFDASTAVTWQNIAWTATTPAGTAVALSVRTGNSSVPDGTWSGFVPIAAPGALGLQSRYIQYRADLSTTDPGQTPALADIIISGSVPITPPTPPPPVKISVGDVMLAEGHSGSTVFAFPVTLSAATDHPVTVAFSTGDGTATVALGDYEAVAGELTFAPGTTGQWIPVVVNGDVYNENDETFTVTLLSASGGILLKPIGAGLILNDDAVPSLSTANVSLVEGNAGTTNMTFTVTLSVISGKSVTVNYATANGSALAPGDYLARSGTLTFAPGTATRTVDVPIVGNTVDAPNKTFVVNLSAPVNATIGAAQATGTIIDDDTSTQTFTTVADFSAGTLDAGAYISETENGEIILAPGIGTEFSGTALPTGWLSTVMLTKGTAVVSNGSIKLQGSQISSTFPLVGVNRTLEFSATLSGAAQQLGGLLLAQFNTKANGATVGLYARTINGSTPIETLIPGNWFNAPHVFRIDWTSTNVVYWIDGAKVATHNVAFPASVKMTVVGSDLFKTTGVLTIDWMRLGPYAPSGTYTSKVFDATAAVNWLTLSWTATVPAGTSVALSYRTGATPTPDATWTAFTPVAISGGALSGKSRYVQFKVQEATTAPMQTPTTKQVVIGFNR